ncbi:hypothetical protein [Oceanobacillus salinisoli]|uniref:hypothetical protein n=1 Tax=Oceanobacillus salinisoli TaxID=2678611 RepID=UPI0012E0F3E7|nr:hypothetical protein [Oceanobacillus salinisoli]
MHNIFHYEVKTPGNFQVDHKYPLLIALHGIGYSEQDMMSLFDPVTDDFILIAPRGNLS